MAPPEGTPRVAARDAHKEHTALFTPALSMEVVHTIAGIEKLSGDYERLGHTCANTLPFALPEWHLTWCRHFLNAHPQLEEQPLFHVLRKGGGECVAIVPLIGTRWRVGPLHITTADLIGADPSISEIRTPLVAPGYEAHTVQAVHGRLGRERDLQWMHWRGLTGALRESVRADAAAHCYQGIQDFVLDLPSSWEEFRGALPRNIRESLRHCYNSLRRDGHRFEFVIARAPADIEPALDRFLQLHALRAAMASGPKHPDRFASPALRSFLHDVCRALAARDAVRVFQLRIGGHTVAARIGFVVGDSLYLYYSGFDPGWARYSVMTTTVAEALRYAMGHGLRSVNLSLTAEQSKLRWRPRLLEYDTALVHRDTHSARLAARAYRAALTGDSVSARLLKGLLGTRRSWQ
jgi:CelD/BcsL family acetyltransferase involved in cellulose biosynthesis